MKAANAPRQDRLIVGGERLPGGNTMNARQMSATVERLERMIEDQGRTAVNIAESLHNLNLAVVETRNYIQALEANQKKNVAEQRALQSRLEQAEQKLEKTQGVWELLMLIIASGGMGGALLMLHHRLRSRRDDTPMPFRGAAEPARESKLAESLPKPEKMTRPVSKPSPPSPPAAPSSAAAYAAPSLAASASLAPSLPTASAPTPFFAPEFSAAAARIAVPPAPTLSIPTPEPELPDHTLRFESPAPPPLSSSPLQAPIEFERTPRPEEKNKHQADFSSPDSNPSPLTFTADSIKHANSWLELASLMESMGLVKEAADIIVEHLMVTPNDDLDPWLTALNLYRKTGRQEEFMTLADKLHETMNVAANAWDHDPLSAQPRSLLDFQRIIARVQELWRMDDKSECEAFLNELLVDNRGSMREGFPQDVAEEISLLLKIIRSAA